ncbi:MAG: Endo,4-beta-xylanase precursor [Labilithrix sp.]|nr:Endo,4-beta-xylanase precursor [Labilithrix sp.]
MLVSLHGRSCNTYWCLRKGGCNYKGGYLVPFEQAMMEVSAAKQIAAKANRSYVVRAVATIHGESDHYSYTEGSQEFPLAGSDGVAGKIQSYADALIEWQADYETGIKAITGQTVPVPLFVSQISGWNDTQYSKVAEFQLDAHVRAPGKVVLIGPSYHLGLDQNDCRHFTSDGERRLGEYFAKVYARVIFEGRPWEPLRPKEVTRNGAVLTAKFHVPSPPLVIDTQRVTEAASYGFVYTDSSAAPPAIQSVAVTGPDTVTITLAAAPSGGNGRLTYAQNQQALSCIGTPNGARGNLRDSDATPSKYGYDLHNWAVSFDVAVP